MPVRTASSAALVRAWNFSNACSKVNFTSAEVKGTPSCHFTFGTSLKV